MVSLMTPTSPPPAVFSARYRALSVGITALIVLVAFEYLAVATAMPEIGEELQGWGLYSLAFSGPVAAALIGTVAGGRWGDLSGPDRPLWTGLATFVTGLLIAGLAPTMEIFIAGRLIQGMGGGMFNVAIYVLVARVYPGAMHPKVFSLLAAAWVLPSVVGPAITGTVTEAWTWRAVFLGVAVLAIPAAVIFWRGLASREPYTQEEKPENGPFAARLAWGGGAAVGAAVLQYGSDDHNYPLMAIGLVVLAVALPMLVPGGTLRAARGLPTVVALRGLSMGAFFAAEVLVPLMLVRERGLTLTEAGLALTGGALAWSAGSWLQGKYPGGRLPRLWGGHLLVAGGISVTALAFLPAFPIWVAFIGWVVCGLGIGMIYPTLSVLVLELSEPGEEGKNSASLSVGESGVTVVAVAVTGAILTATGAYAVCFALLVVMALAGALLSRRVTMEV
ncbi:MFS transporter [Herbidospora sp. RD11066]